MHTLQSAEQVYGDGEAPHRIALALLETFLRERGRPLGTQGRAGPSDEQDAKRGVEASSSTAPDRGGVNANATKAHLLDVAKRLDVSGRSRMTRDELVVAIDPANRTATSKASRAGRSNDPGETGNNDLPLARPGPLTDVTSGAGALVATVFTALIVVVLDEAVAVAKNQLCPRAVGFRAYEKVEWTRAVNDHWVAVQAYKGSLRATKPVSQPHCCAKEGVAELPRRLSVGW